MNMKTQPTLYRTDGTEKIVAPESSENFTMEEIKNFVGGYPKVVFLKGETLMIVNMEAMFEELPLNVRATEIARQNGRLCNIVGDALVCPSKMFK
jgi:hypothetical protein